MKSDYAIQFSDEVIITAGSAYTDIDVFACAAAYQNLLHLKNSNAQIVLPGVFNESIPSSIRNLGISYLKEYSDKDNAKYILVDVSDPNYLPAFINQKKVIKVFDHHWGYKDYWKDKIGEGATIEFVGSCATLLYEAFVKEELLSKIDTKAALLLYTASVSNTLNLHAQITSKRDIDALEALSVHVSPGWKEKYFLEVTAAIENNPERAMANDTKNLTIAEENYSIIQIELWNSKKFIDVHYKTIITALQNSPTPHAFFTSPSISEGVNYFVTVNDKMKSLLKKSINAEFDGDIGKTSKLWLRKEIIKVLYGNTN